MVLHSANHEIIGVRHRASQTLYVSKVMEPHNSEPAYGKIHVGIYIAAILETVDRINQEKEMVGLSPAPQQQNDKGGDDGKDDKDGNEKDDDNDDDSRKQPKLDESQPSKGKRTGTRADTSRGKKRAVFGNVDQVSHWR
jgi:hypothetical protein